MNGESAASQAPADQGKTASNRAESIAGFLPRTGNGPLSGQLVVDFSRVLAGPYSTMMLADLGATVIKVEGPSGDDTRHWDPRSAMTMPPTICRSTATNSTSSSTSLMLMISPWPRSLLPEPTSSSRTSNPGAEEVRPRLRLVSDTNAEVIYASVTGFGAHNATARLRPAGPGDVRFHERHRRPGWLALPRRCRGLRRHHRSAHDDRDHGSDPAQESHRRGTAGRDQSHVLSDVGPSEPVGSLCSGGCDADSHGQRPPEPLPVPADGDKGRRTHRGCSQ